MSRDEIKLFAREYAICNAYFPRCLTAVAANIPDDATRLPLIENIWEEHGLGDLRASHRTMFARFTVACGLPPTFVPSLEDSLPSTVNYVQRIFDICRQAHFLEGLGALGPGTELITSRQYVRLLAGLAATERFTDDDLVFFKAHIGLDEEHSAELEHAMTPWLDDRDGRARIRRGARAALELEIAFWDGLSRATSRPGAE